jgi:di- and tripeptidase
MTGLQPRELDDGCSDTAPDQLQELRHDGSVLAIAVSDRYLFAGTSKGEISIWSLGTYQLVQTIQAHKRSVLCLLLSEDQKYLFSSACEPIIGVWCPKTFTRLYEIYSTYDVGDVFSIAYSPQKETLYLGTQTQDIQWVGLKDPTRRVPHDSANHPDKRQHRFFDSRAVGGTSTPRRMEEHYSLIPKAGAVLEIDSGAIRQYAHYGWIFCMLIAKGPTVLGGPDEEVLISGGGDGTIKLWRLCDDGPDHDDGVLGDIEEMVTLGEDDSESVMSIAVDGSFLYAGKLGGIIELWDLDTKQKLRVIKAHEGNVNTLRMSFGLLWSGATGGSASVSHNPAPIAHRLTPDRSTARCTTAETKMACLRTTSAKSTSVSADGRHTMPRSCRPPWPCTKTTSSSLPERTTTRSASGALMACRHRPSRRLADPRT